MKKSQKISVLILMLNVFFAVSQAQDRLTLNLNKALEIALSENKTVKIANKEIERQNYLKKENIGNFFPSISASGNYARNVMKPVLFLPPEFAGGGAIKLGYDNSFTAGAQATLPIVAPALAYSLQLSEIEIENALESARSSKLNLMAEVKKAYYVVLLAQEALNAVEQNYNNAQKTVKDVENMFNQGLVAEFDLLTAQVQLSNLLPALNNAKKTLDLSYLSLKMLLSLPESVQIGLENNLNDYLQRVMYANIPEKVDFSNNSDLLKLDLQSKKISKQFELMRTQRMPILAAYANYQLQAQDNTFKFSSYNWANSLSVGLSLNVPIFNGWSKMFREKQVKLGMEQIKLQKSYLEDHLKVQATNYIANLIQAKEQLNATQNVVKQAEKAYQISSVRYNTGQGTLLERTNAETQLLQSKLLFNQSIYNYLSAEADFDKMLGKE